MHILHMTSAPATNPATNSAAAASALFENLLFSVVRADN
jgi:hypothetical protein